jgi:hypothetical protein
MVVPIPYNVNTDPHEAGREESMRIHAEHAESLRNAPTPIHTMDHYNWYKNHYRRFDLKTGAQMPSDEAMVEHYYRAYPLIGGRRMRYKSTRGRGKTNRRRGKTNRRRVKTHRRRHRKH